MASANDLTTLIPVQAWLEIGGSVPANTNLVLGRLITSCSGAIMAYLQRSSFLSQDFTDTFDGRANRFYSLNEWPVTAVKSVTVDGEEVPHSPDAIAAGWTLSAWNGYPPGSPQSVDLIGGYCFDRGRQNATIVYTAGYAVLREAHTIPATPFEIPVTSPQGPWSQDIGVTYANGTPLVMVASGPTVGQYAIVPPSATIAQGTYLFAAADAGAQILMSYSYVPSAVEDACINLVSERYRMRSRIGQRSQSIGGQTSNSYELSDIPAYIKTQLQPFRKVLPT